MNLNSVIRHQIRGNFHTYKEYFLATLFSVAVIFMTLLVVYHPEMQLSSLSQNFAKAAKAVTAIIGIFLFIFIYYSEYTFIKHRSRDYAMLTIVGMKRSQLIFLNFCESFTVFFSALITGVLISILLSKLIFIAFAALLDIDRMALYLPTNAFVVVFFIFSAIFIVIQISASIILSKSKLKDFLQFGKKAQILKKVNIPVAILGTLLIVTAYYLAATADTDNILQRIIPVVLMDVVGMYCFYREMCPFILELLSKNRHLYYKGINLIWISDLKYRIKDFTIILFLITVTMSVGLTGFAAVFNVASSELETGPSKDSQFQAAVMHSDTLSPTVMRVEKMLDSLEISFSKEIISLKTDNSGNSFLIRNSDLRYVFQPDLLSKYDLSKSDTTAIKYQYKDLNMPLFYGKIMGVKDDMMALYNIDYKTVYMTFFTYKEKSGVARALSKINDAIYFGDNKEERLSSPSLFRYWYFIMRQSYLFLSFYFIIVFYICAGCMLYFKFFNNYVEEQKKYSGYSKVGLSRSEIRKSSTILMASLFFIPWIMTVLNASFAMLAIIRNDAPKTFITNTIIIIGFTLIIQIIYFLFIRTSYLRKILK